MILCGISERITELLSPLSKAIYRVLKLCPWKRINTVSHLACRKAIILNTKRGRKVIFFSKFAVLSGETFDDIEGKWRGMPYSCVRGALTSPHLSR